MNRPTPVQDRIKASLPEIYALIDEGFTHRDIRESMGISNTAWDTAIAKGIIQRRKKPKTVSGRLLRHGLKIGRVRPDMIDDDTLQALAAFARKNDIPTLAEAMQEIALDAVAEGRT